METPYFLSRKSKLEARKPEIGNRIAGIEIRNSKLGVRRCSGHRRFSTFDLRVGSLAGPLLFLFMGIVAWGAAPRARHSEPSSSANAAAQAALARARVRVMTASPLAMFYYSDDSLGHASLEAHADAITVLAPKCYELDRGGALRGQLPGKVRGAASRAGLPLMPLVSNPGFDRQTAHALLHSAYAQQRAASSLAEVAEKNGYVGWQLDFEGIDPADKLAYTRFVARVAGRMHHQHRLLSVALVPRFSDRYPDRPGARFYTGEWGAAYDYRGLGRIADFVVLMAYDQHTILTPPGPVAGYDWAKAALDYAVARVPRSKLLLGLPLYGREWAETSGGVTSHSLAYKDLKPYLEDPASVQHWDDLLRTTWFELRDGNSLRTAWFDDARSLREKLRLVQIYALRGFAAWRLGVEDPDFWLVRSPQSGEQGTGIDQERLSTP